MAWTESSSRGEREVNSVWMGLRSHESCSSLSSAAVKALFHLCFHLSWVFGERDECAVVVSNCLERKS